MPEPTTPAPHRSRRILRAGFVAALSLAVFAGLIAGVLLDDNAWFDWDVPVARALQAIDLAGFAEFMELVSAPANAFASLAAVFLTVCLMLLLVGWWREALVFALCVAAEGPINRFTKEAVGRPRPSADLVTVHQKASGFSFPSGHVTNYVNCYGFLFYLAWRRSPSRWSRRLVLVVLGGLVLLVGPSRVYLGAHWPSDVLAAYALGLGWLSFNVGLYEYLSSQLRGDPRDQRHGHGRSLDP